jgi:hypothetical protein
MGMPYHSHTGEERSGVRFVVARYPPIGRF